MAAEASVPKTETRNKYTVYKVYVTVNNKSWFIFRRYHEFHHLHENLTKMFPDLGLKLPGRKLFGTRDPSFVEKRRVGLDNFVRKILDDKRITKLQHVRDFFGLDRANQAGSSSDDSDYVSRPNSTQSDSRKDSRQDSGNKDDEDSDSDINLGPTERKTASPSDFDFLKTIGKGSFGKVFMVRMKSDKRLYAMKVLSKAHVKKRNEVKHIMSERSVLISNIKHPFLVGLHFSFRTKDKLYFILTYLNGGELFFHLQREKTFAEPRARFYAAEIASALGYLHEKQIIYRDLKPENLLLDDEGHVVLTDFGLCKEGMTGKETTTTFCGTPEYLAPEVIQKQPYDRTVDWWCLGSVLYEMLFGLPPFYSRDHREMYSKILNEPLKIKSGISAEARDILVSMLRKDRKKRMGQTRDFQELKDHPFFNEIDWDSLLKLKIKPPFKPTLKNALDTKYIDREFLDLQISNSVRNSYYGSVKNDDQEFVGFTYVPAMDDIAE